MDKTLQYTIISTVIVAGVTAFFGSPFNLFITPQYDIEPPLSINRCNDISNTTLKDECNSSNAVYLERITIKNTGLKQAKNVDAYLTSTVESKIDSYSCFEGIITDTQSTLIHKIKFERFSTKFSCTVQFFSKTPYPITNIVISSDDTAGFVWKSDDNVQQAMWTTLFTLIVAMAAATAFLSYSSLQLLKYFIKRSRNKNLHIPTNVKSYSCEMMFEEPIENGSDDIGNKAETRAINRVNVWLDQLKKIATSERQTTTNDGKQITLQIPEGEIDVVIQNVTTQYRGTYYKAARVRMSSKRLEAMDRVLEQGRHPCWTFFWELYTELDVETIVTKIRQKTGRNPGSHASSATGKEIPVITDATYGIMSTESSTIRVSLSKGVNNGKIGIIFDPTIPNKGIMRIKKILTLEKIFLILFGQISSEKILEIMRMASTTDDKNNK